MPLKRKWSDNDLTSAFNKSSNVAEIINELGLALSGGTYANIKKHLERLNLKFSDDSKSRQLKGIKKFQYSVRYSDSDVFVENSKVSQQTLRTRYFQVRSVLCCDKCGIKEWNGQPLVFQIDHKNGNNKDNRLENLRLLCPNCHSQTPTYGGKNKRSGAGTGIQGGLKNRCP